MGDYGEKPTKPLDEKSLNLVKNWGEKSSNRLTNYLTGDIDEKLPHPVGNWERKSRDYKGYTNEKISHYDEKVERLETVR